MEPDKSIDYTHYIAIDFGTAGCGIAVSTSAGETPWMYRAWLPGGPSNPQKCPTIMLLDHNLECEAFGKKNLLKNYHKKSVKHPDRIDEYYLFQYFKMNLYEEKSITRDLMITALDGKTLPAITVFSKALQYMRKIVIEDLDKQVAHPARSILWILTVPAIWSHAARQMMRIAAIQAGFDTEHDSLTLALEPEAASLYCIEISELLESASQNTNCHMIVDCGGGTVDIAVHRWDRNADGKTLFVDEIHKVHGGPCGSFAVNKQFEMFLKELLQLSDIEILDSFASQWNALVYHEFDQKKGMFGPDDNSKTITIIIPEKICDYIETAKNTNVEDLVKSYSNRSLEWDEDEGAIVVSHDVMLGFFKPVFDQIIHHVDNVLKAPECKTVTKIVLVGGFAVSQYLNVTIRQHFPNYTVERGQNPWLSVVFGAIKFGKNQSVIRSRIMRQTIGIETWDKFVPGYHDEKHKREVHGKVLCTKVFTKFFEVNERISTENCGNELPTYPASDDDVCAIKVYSSYDKGIKYVDDFSCFVLGTLVIEGLPRPQSNLSREIRIRIDATGPQILVTATNNGKRLKQLKLNLLK